MKTIKKILPLAMIAMFLTGCSHDDDNYVIIPQAAQQFDGSMQSIENFLTPDVLNAMEDLGVVINPGSTPPDLSGDYFGSIWKLQASNVSGDSTGSVFADVTMHFNNQNDQNHTIDFSYSQAGETGVGNGTLVSGNGDNFTAFLKQTATHGTQDAEVVTVITGTKTAAGFTNLQWAYFMKDNHGNSSFFPNGHGRVFYDSDGLVVRL